MQYTIYMGGDLIGTCALNADEHLVVEASAEYAEDIRGLIQWQFLAKERGKDFAGFFTRLNRYLRGYVSAVADTALGKTPRHDMSRAVQRDPARARARREIIMRRRMSQTA
jgi:hypothetical protein